jgi:hypothetical protein
MRVGLSYSRCVLDIVEGRVDINDVLVLITRTDFDPRDDYQWAGIWNGYTQGRGFSVTEWDNYDTSNKDHEDKFRSVSIMLWDDGKLHQPRKFGQMPARRSAFWLETVLPDEELANNPAAKAAWDKFQTVAGLANVTLDKAYK